MTAWKTTAPLDTDAAIHAREDELMKVLADAKFESTPPVAENAPPAAAPAPVPAMPVHAVDPDYQAVHAALQAGTIPTFADPAGTAPVAAVPLDVAAERAAYAQFIAFLNAHKDPDTEITALDPEAYAKGLI